jgi:tRNA A-37 threonylcarbamoyl transferase component Bud32
MFPNYGILNPLVKSFGFGTASHINSEIRILDKMEEKGFDTPKILGYGNFKCEEGKDSYRYLIKEYILGKNWHIGMTLNSDQLKELEDKVKTFHSHGFANLDLGPGNRSVNILVGEDSHIHLFDMNLVKEKPKTHMFQRYVEVDLMNLEQIMEYNSWNL